MILSKKIILSFLLIYFYNLTFSQKYIEGYINDFKHNKDSIMFITGTIKDIYYEKPKILAEVDSNKFKLINEFSYPQMYYVGWYKERSIYPFKNGEYFFDQATKKIEIDSIYFKSKMLGPTYYEYKNKFLPYFAIETNNFIDSYTYEHGKIFDLKLSNYIIENPDSYVGLWFLIKRFEENGYSSLYEKSLNSFSSKMKSGKLWKILNTEFSIINIKEESKFPALLLKNTDLINEKIYLPNSKYTLIDFWFSRCKPCLEQIPQLKKIYKKYKDKGLNIISISTDKTINIEIWKKRILEYEIHWKNYLDENAEIAKSENIKIFPTLFLLDNTGNLIKRGITIEELENFLNINIPE